MMILRRYGTLLEWDISVLCDCIVIGHENAHVSVVRILIHIDRISWKLEAGASAQCSCHLEHRFLSIVSVKVFTQESENTPARLEHKD